MSTASNEQVADEIDERSMRAEFAFDPAVEEARWARAAVELQKAARRGKMMGRSDSDCLDAGRSRMLGTLGCWALPIARRCGWWPRV